MTTQLKSDTARANGAKSRGPKTAAGQEKSSRNALKHGFASRKMVLLECEDPDSFKEFLAEYAATYKPANAAELNLVDEMIAARWRMQRYWAVETALLDDAMKRKAPVVENQPVNYDGGIQLARAFRAMADESHALSLLSRYESRFHRIFHRAYQTLRELQQSPKLQAAEPAQPEPLPSPPPEAVKPEAVKEDEPRPAGNFENTNPALPLPALRLCVKIKGPTRPPLCPSTKKLRNEPSVSRTLRRLRTGKLIHLLGRKRHAQSKVA